MRFVKLSLSVCVKYMWGSVKDVYAFLGDTCMCI